MEEDGKGALNIRVERDENGEQRIVMETKSGTALTTDRIKQIQDMSSSEAAMELTSARDKLIWFRHQVDQNTVDFTQGCNEIRINRENLIQDSLRYFLDLRDLRKVSGAYKVHSQSLGNQDHLCKRAITRCRWTIARLLQLSDQRVTQFKPWSVLGCHNLRVLLQG